jgi:hypothetical protein
MTTTLLISIVAAVAAFALVAVAVSVALHRSAESLRSAHLMHAAQPPAEQRRRPRWGRRRDYSALL